MPERLVTAVISMYVESRSKVKTVAGTSEAFDIRVEVHESGITRGISS